MARAKYSPNIERPGRKPHSRLNEGNVNYWTRNERARLSRRRLLSGTAVATAGLSSLALVGCGDDDDDETPGGSPTTGSGTTPPAAQGKRGGTLRGLTIISSNLDPHRTTATISFGRIYSKLMRFSTSDPGRIEGDLAATLPEIAPDGVTITFKLRPEATWQDRAPVSGRQVTAADVKLSFDRIKDPATVSPRAGLYANVESTTVIDPLTLQFKLKVPQADIFAIMSDLFMDVLPREISSRGLDAIKGPADVIGSGPYELTDFAAAQKLTLKRRADGHWRENTAWLDGYDYLHQTDPQQLANALRAEQADSAGLPVDIAVTFEKNEKFVITQAPSPIKECLVINHNRDRYKDPKVRLALSRAVNRQQVYENVYGGGGTPSGPMTPAGPFWALSESELRKLPGFGDRDTEIKEAKALLSAAGLANGFEETVLAITAFELDKVHDVLVSNLRDIGVTVKTENVGTDVAANMLPRLVNGEFGLATFGFASGAYPDAQLMLYHHSDKAKKGTRNYSSYANPELDAKLERQSTIYDEDERLPLVQEIQRELISNPGPAWIGVRTGFGIYNARLKNVQSFGFNSEHYDSENVWIEA